MVVETQIDGHLDLVTATLARPSMPDFVVAHVWGLVRTRHWIVARTSLRVWRSNSNEEKIQNGQPHYLTLVEVLGPSGWLVARQVFRQRQRRLHHDIAGRPL